MFVYTEQNITPRIEIYHLQNTLYMVVTTVTLHFFAKKNILESFHVLHTCPCHT